MKNFFCPGKVYETPGGDGFRGGLPGSGMPGGERGSGVSGLPAAGFLFPPRRRRGTCARDWRGAQRSRVSAGSAGMER